MFSSFTLLITADDILPLKAEVERWKDIVDIVASYKIDDYYFIELLVMGDDRDEKDLLKFVLRQFNFIALHQSKSTYIFAKDKEELKTAILDLYTKESKEGFFYDMLSVDERYKALMTQGLDKKFDIQLWHYDGKSGNYYALNISTNSVFLFDYDPCVEILDNTTGSITEYDIIDGLKKFQFHIGILGSEKLEKTSRNIL